MNRILQRRLLILAAAFLTLQALILTLSPAVRLRSWDVDYRWSHWVVLGVWALMAARAHHDTFRKLPDADPYLLPAAALLSGWGALTIWRLDPVFGARQTLWLAVGLGIFSLGTRLPSLQFLSRYKYTLLSGGLLLAMLTVLFGVNPLGNGPRLWLGYGDLYLQPSEPLKLLLVVFLSAYFADRLPARLRLIHILYPTIILSGFVIMLLIVQRDLGTAAIFTALYVLLVYLVITRKRILLLSVLVLIMISLLGYATVGIIRARMDLWLNPWHDPAGNSYQVIQALIAIANGGLPGTGLGLGSPGLIPVAISDFIYAAIAEENGLIGTLGLLALLGLIIARGLRIALHATDLFRRFLAAGITAYFGLQSILIIGGNIRLLPLTGVTLPFMSYGGSSLVTSFIALLILIHISNHMDDEPAPLPVPQPYLVLGALLGLGLFASALVTGWWSVVRGPDLLTRTDNRRHLIEQRFVPRGLLLDRSNNPINDNRGEIGSYARNYNYVDLAPITGYTDPVYGQAGLEAILDEYLRGVRGNPVGQVVWSNLLYGTDPHGLDIRLSIDLYLQFRADEMLLGHSGAVILMNAQSGEILVMASHPTFNPNHLQETGAKLQSDPGKPLLNRATQGQYVPGAILEPFIEALAGTGKDIAQSFGLDLAPLIELPVAPVPPTESDGTLRLSPLQLALAASALANHGTIPAPRLAMGVNTTTEGWVSLPAQGVPFEAVQAPAADEAAQSYLIEGKTFWQHMAQARDGDQSVTWLIGGTPPNWQGAPLALVVVLEENNPRLAQRIGRELLVDAMNP